MSETMPNCRRCGRPYTTPSGGGYCEDHRQFPLCTQCGGSGWDSSWQRSCGRCKGTRHERDPRTDFVAVDAPVDPVVAVPTLPEWLHRALAAHPHEPSAFVERLPGETRQEWRRRMRAAGGGT